MAPIVAKGQQALLELLQLSDPKATRLFDAGPIEADTNTLTFDVQGIPPGQYLVRIRVNGAASPLDLDPSGTPVASPIEASLWFSSGSGGTASSLRISLAIVPVYSG